MEDVQTFLSQVLRNRVVMLMAGGALGTYLRYVLSRWFDSQPWGQEFPFGTMFINVTGSFILAATAVVVLERLPPEHQDWYFLIGTGFCGGFTTFSTFEWETFRLVRDGSWWHALGNVLGSVGAGFLGILAGVTLIAVIFPRK